MTRSVIKTAFMAAVLGCVMLVTSPAYAGTKQVIMVCEEDSSGDKLLITKIFADSPLGAFPAEVSVGSSCVGALVFFNDGGFVILDEAFEGLTSTSFDLPPSQPTIFGSAKAALESLGLGQRLVMIVHLRCRGLQCFAGIEEVMLVIEEDSLGDKLVIKKIFADLPPEDLPSDLSVGQDALQALVILENGGAEIFEETLSQESAPEAGGRTGDAPEAGQGSNYAIFHLRCQKLQGECFE